MRGIKGLMLAVFAATALLVAPASALALGGFTAGKYPASVEGTTSGNNGFVFVGHGTDCSGMSFADELEEPVSTLASESVSDPTCTKGAMEMNGCQFEFHPGTGTVDIGPSGCGPAKLVQADCSATLTVPPQTGLAATYENVGSGSKAGVHVLVDDEQVEYSVSGNLCKAAGTYTSGLRLYLEIDVTAQNASEEAIGLSVVSGGNGDVSLALEGDAEEEAQLTAGEYPAQIAGERMHLGEASGEITLWQASGKSVSCDAAEFDGGELTGPHGEVELAAEYSGCVLENGEVETSVDTNGCRYVYSSLALGGEGYEGAAEIACDEGSAISFNLEGLCTMEVPAQTLSDAALFANRTFSKAFPNDWSEVFGTMSGSSIEYAVSGSFCFLIGLETGTYEDASAHSDMVLFGESPS